MVCEIYGQLPTAKRNPGDTISTIYDGDGRDSLGSRLLPF